MGRIVRRVEASGVGGAEERGGGAACGFVVGFGRGDDAEAVDGAEAGGAEA